MKLCIVDFKHRYTAEEALNHPWITRKFEDPIPLDYNEALYKDFIKKRLGNLVNTFVYISRLFASKTTKTRNVN